MLLMILYIISILILIYFVCFKRMNEAFNVVGYNNTKLQDDKITSIYDNETDMITKELVFKEAECDFDKSGYTIHGMYIEFPLKNIFKQKTLYYLENLNIFKNDKLEMHSDINNLYWKNESDNRVFIFDVNIIINSPKFMIRNIQVKILIKNVMQFMNANGSYRTDNVYDKVNEIEIECIKLNDNFKSNNMIKGIDELKPLYHEITNRLNLTEPF